MLYYFINSHKTCAIKRYTPPCNEIVNYLNRPLGYIPIGIGSCRAYCTQCENRTRISSVKEMRPKPFRRTERISINSSLTIIDMSCHVTNAAFYKELTYRLIIIFNFTLLR